MMTEAKPRVLIVDDETDICELLKEEMDDRGFEAETATSVDEALGLLDRFAPQVIVSDVRMPGKSGLDLIREVNENLTPVPVILVSGFTDASAQTIFELGAAGLFAKPIDTDALERLMRKAIAMGSTPLDKRHSTREATKIPARFGIRSEDSPSDLIEAHLCNLSRGGAYFRCEGHEVPQVGETVCFHFHDPKISMEPVHGLGVCRWNHGSSADHLSRGGFGLEFSEIRSVCFPAFFDYITVLGSLNFANSTES